MNGYWFWSEGGFYPAHGQFFWRERGWHFCPAVYVTNATTPFYAGMPTIW